MSLTTAFRCRSLVRAGTVGLVVAASGLVGASSATAAEDGRPVIALDPPDVAVFLSPQEDEGGYFGWADAAASVADEGGAAAAALTQAAALPPEAATALAAQAGMSAAVPPEDYGLDVPYGSTLHLQIPAEVDAATAEFVLDVYTNDMDDLPRRYASDPMPSDQPLVVNDLGGGVFDVTVPAVVPPYGPQATLSVQGLTHVATGADLMEPLDYYLELTGAAATTVNLSPIVNYVSHATCSVEAEESCPAPTAQAGRPLDFVVPPGSLLATLGFVQLDTAYYSLVNLDDGEPFQYYDSETNPELVTAQGPSSATMTVPAGARSGPYIGFIMQGDPTVGMAVTVFELEVQGIAANRGLHSDTGWVEDVREVSSGSTAAVAGGALLLVSGLVGVAAVRPGRRPPLGG